MKFHVALQSGQWIGGLMCRRDNLIESLEELQPLAKQWGEPIVVTRSDGKPRGSERYIVSPRRITRQE